MLGKQVVSYSLVGILNTLIHWCIFFIVYHFIHEQSVSNVIAFLCAVIFSFFMNARFTFKKKSTYGKMILYISFMGSMNFIIGYISDTNNFSSLVTLLVSSIIGPVLGFIFSKFLVFRG
ncbi:GtrA family protein [Actinobacillus equuli subsp. equuli]|uniref:GtrA family protein n=1 Tax=Actinobacillus equuli TaxID=718 RepID=UPI0024419669|nr:GtrA family protein [Actinobacillus equuli]WGE54978.1 GtrA family protein [Actinobacillus equuli subsp. equuli]